MLKLPKLGRPVNSFLFISNINRDELDVAIVFQKLNFFGSFIHKVEFFVLYTDEREKSLQTMKQKIDHLLSSAQGSVSVAIRADQERTYLYFGPYQFSGRLAD